MLNAPLITERDYHCAAAAWSELDVTQQVQWQSAAKAYHMNGYYLYLREYIDQAVTPPEQPIIPPSPSCTAY